MKITDRLRIAFDTFRKAENAMGTDLARSFLRYGNQKPLVQDWSKVVVTDKELYTGYPYAAINNRANKVAQLANENLKTDSKPEIMKAAKAKGESVIHPYLDVIDKSQTFSNNKFWYDISTFLDLEGVYYLMAVRTVEGQDDGSTRVGNIQEFKLLNPYDMRRIINRETLEVGGYVEARDGLIREFAPPMIVEMRKLNPFSHDDPFAMTDAAKESQFTLKQAGDYTRHSLKNNMAAPGIISTDVLLDPQQFDNFVNRVTNQEKGLPLFGNGAGAITWDSMQIDMDKAALDKIQEINRQTLFAVSGVGKTMMAIEESGTTRDTAKVQKDLFVENHVMPQLQLILDSLNQDYKIYSSKEYTTNKYTLYVDNPLGSDRDAELLDIQIRDDQLKLYDDLVAMGYKRDVAAKYAQGEITLEELGNPTEEPRPNPIIEAAKLKAGDNPVNPNLEPPTKKDTKKKATDEKGKQDFEKEDNFNPNHDRLGKFGRGARSGDGGSSGWKPIGTKAEADAFAKGSKVRDTVYHGTTKSAGTSIGKKGFETNHKSKIGDTNFPGAVMFTKDRGDAVWYSHQAAGSKVGKSSLISARIKSSTNKRMTMDQWHKARVDYGKKHGIELYTRDGSMINEGFNKASAGVLTDTFKTNDSITLKGSFGGGDTVMVQDKSSVMAFGVDDV